MPETQISVNRSRSRRGAAGARPDGSDGPGGRTGSGSIRPREGVLYDALNGRRARDDPAFDETALGDGAGSLQQLRPELALVEHVGGAVRRLQAVRGGEEGGGAGPVAARQRQGRQPVEG